MPLIVADLVAQNREEAVRLEHQRDTLLAQLAADREELPKLVQLREQQRVRLQRQHPLAKGRHLRVLPEQRAFQQHPVHPALQRGQLGLQLCPREPAPLERVPRGELLIAANEATCIYVLPRVFSEYKKEFPIVQLLVDRSYGTNVVTAVLDNLADFGITQLPVEEKRLQVVKIHSDEIKLLTPPNHPLASKRSVVPTDLKGYPLLMPKAGTE